MPFESKDKVDSAILRALDEYHNAMVKAEAEVLDSLLDKKYFLVHITGYKQPKAEWLDVIHKREFDYHDIRLQQGTLQVEQQGGTAEVKGRGIFNATIWGMESHWRLQFE
jgi:hypothetical protein